MSKLQELIAVHKRNRHLYSDTVRWRGVEYSPRERSQRRTITKTVKETYRGVPHTETINVEVN